MTKKELSQAYYIALEIRELEKERKRIRDKSYIGGGGGSSHGSGIGDRTASRAIAEVELEQKISEMICRLNVEKLKIIKYMQSIDDSLIRQIIYYRYFKLYAWGRVAHEVGGPNTADSVRKLSDRYIETHCER